MKKLHFLTKNFALIIVLTLCTVQVFAQDKITLTWRPPAIEGNRISYTATPGGPFLVNWGDGIIDIINNEESGSFKHEYESGDDYEVTITASDVASRFLTIYCSEKNISKLNLSGCFLLQTLACTQNALTNLDVSNCTALKGLSCFNNKITDLNLSGCTALQILNFMGNRITHLDVSVFTALRDLNCLDNQLQLSELYAIKTSLHDSCIYNFGNQYLTQKWANIDTELFADQSFFDGEFTNYQVQKYGTPILESDYSVLEGKLIFHTPGLYSVGMTNKAIHASVTGTLEVVTVGVSENESLSIEVYPNPTTGELRIENGELRIEKVEIFDIYGKNVGANLRVCPDENQIDMSDLASGVYFVKIYTEEGVVVKKVIKN